MPPHPRLLQELKQPYRTMVSIAGGLGLRVSEIGALQWGDFDCHRLTLTVTRGCVQGRVGEVKTEYSHRPLPLDPALAKEVLQWKEEGPYPNKGAMDFVFPNLKTGKPMWQESILDRQIKPAQSGTRGDWLAYVSPQLPGVAQAHEYVY